MEYHLFRCRSARYRGAGSPLHRAVCEVVGSMRQYMCRAGLGRTNQMDNVPWPQMGQDGQLGTLIVVTSYLLLSLKLKFVNVTKERSIVCSSNKTFLCWGPFPYSWHAGEVKSFEKSPSKVKTQTVSVIKSLPAWSNCFSWRPFFDSEYLRRFIHRLHTFPFILSTYFYLVLLFILSASYPRLRKVFTVLTCDDPTCF